MADARIFRLPWGFLTFRTNLPPWWRWLRLRYPDHTAYIAHAGRWRAIFIRPRPS